AAPAFPARCPARVGLWRVLLGQRPSLHSLRQRLPAFVRPFCRYYAAVRLPAFVHGGLVAHRLLLPARTLSTGVCGVSRFSRMEFLCMPGVSDFAGPHLARDVAMTRCCLPYRLTPSAPRTGLADFGAQYPAYRYPCPTLQVRRYRRPHMARGQSGSLLLLCTTLSFATPCRFIPVLSRRSPLSSVEQLRRHDRPRKAMVCP